MGLFLDRHCSTHQNIDNTHTELSHNTTLYTYFLNTMLQIIIMPISRKTLKTTYVLQYYI